MPDKQPDNYFISVSESINSIYELATRVDERVRLLMKKHDELVGKIDNQSSRLSEIETEVRIMESHDPAAGTQAIASELERVSGSVAKLEDQLDEAKGRLQLVEISNQGSAEKWNKLVSYFIQLLWLVLAGWLLYKLGLPAP